MLIVYSFVRERYFSIVKRHIYIKTIFIHTRNIYKLKWSRISSKLVVTLLMNVSNESDKLYTLWIHYFIILYNVLISLSHYVLIQFVLIYFYLKLACVKMKPNEPNNPTALEWSCSALVPSLTGSVCPRTIRNPFDMLELPALSVVPCWSALRCAVGYILRHNELAIQMRWGGLGVVCDLICRECK